MKAEYKNCPKCHIINAPNAEKCECGYIFSKGEALTDKELARIDRQSKKKNVLISALILAFIALYIALSIKFGFLFVLVYSIGFVIAALFILYVVSNIKSKHDRERLGD